MPIYSTGNSHSKHSDVQMTDGTWRNKMQKKIHFINFHKNFCFRFGFRRWSFLAYVLFSLMNKSLCLVRCHVSSVRNVEHERIHTHTLALLRAFWINGNHLNFYFVYNNNKWENPYEMRNMQGGRKRGTATQQNTSIFIAVYFCIRLQFIVVWVRGRATEPRSRPLSIINQGRRKIPP